MNTASAVQAPDMRRRPYIPVLDGLRAVAVVAVVLYHLGLSWMPGGFLGVDVFFVISGYVITRLLLDAIGSEQGLDLRTFYRARVRRLAPAFIVMLTGVLAMALTWQRETLRTVLRDTPSALLGVENWALLLRNADYFASMGRPSLLQHTWSLAIEAQFYLVWPLVLVAVLRRSDRASLRRGIMRFAIATAFIVVMMAPRISHAHLYYGTDTHITGLLLGCALAISWGPERLSARISPTARVALDAVAVAAGAGLLAVFLLVQGDGSQTFHRSFIIASVLASVLLAVAVHPATRVTRVLAMRGARWLGTRSYSIYLWHWPVFQVMRPGLDIVGNRHLIEAVSLAIVLALAEASYRYIETPWRAGARPLQHLHVHLRPAVLAATAAAGLAMALITVAAVSATRSDDPASLPVSSVSTLPSRLATAQPSAEASTPATPVASPSSAAVPVTPASAAQTPVIDVFGDSVLLGVRSLLARDLRLGTFDAVVGRQADELRSVIENADVAASHGVLMNIGNNGYIQRDDMRTLLRDLRSRPLVIIVNTSVQRIWREHNNTVIREVSAAFPNVRVVDWFAASEGHPEYFVSDGVHLAKAGSRRFAAMVTATAMAAVA